MDPDRVRTRLRFRVPDARDGLVLTQMHPGSWCGREELMGFEDLAVAVRDA